MLIELENVRQIKEEGCRRWFSDDYFDLIVWYDYAKNIDGFQLCYDKNRHERALTWTQDGGFRHDSVDSGESPYSSKKTPVIVRNGVFNKTKIAELFKRESKYIDRKIADLVYKKIIKFK